MTFFFITDCAELIYFQLSEAADAGNWKHVKLFATSGFANL